MDEPTTSISEAFAASIQRAIYALPAAHHVEPRQSEPVNDKDKSYARLSRLGVYTRSELEDRFQQLTNIDELKNTRFSGDQYRNNGRNIMMKAAVDAVNKQRKLKGRPLKKLHIHLRNIP